MKSNLNWMAVLGALTMASICNIALIQADQQESSKLDVKTIDRLRAMFRDSHKMATDGLVEFNVMRHIKDKFDTVRPKLNSPYPNSDQPRSSSREMHNLNEREKLSSDEKDSPTKTTSLPSADDHTRSKMIKSDARQSSFLSGFKFPSSPLSNPLASNPFGSSPFGSNPLAPNLLSPFSLPSLPTLPSAAPKPSKPKSSIIGNNGGATSLTNDNVVVVNVLSNNYR